MTRPRCPRCRELLFDVREVGPQRGLGQPALDDLVLVGDCDSCREVRQLEFGPAGLVAAG